MVSDTFFWLDAKPLFRFYFYQQTQACIFVILLKKYKKSDEYINIYLYNLMNYQRRHGKL